jgi:hypothetical protein
MKVEVEGGLDSQKVRLDVSPYGACRHAPRRWDPQLLAAAVRQPVAQTFS